MTMTSEMITNGAATIAAPMIQSALAVSEPDRALGVFSNETNFVAGQRIAKALATSTLVPEAFRNNLPNTLIAMELANRIGASVLMVMQNLDIIHGRPSWRATFLIATVNASGRFTPLRFRFVGKDGSDGWGCRAVAKDRETGEECVGPLVTIGTAKSEGWYSKSGSKWKTIPELMLTYRAAGWWTRIYSPELSLGMSTADEIEDVGGYKIGAVPVQMSATIGDTKQLEAELLGSASEGTTAPQSPPSDPGMREPGEDG